MIKRLVFGKGLKLLVFCGPVVLVPVVRCVGLDGLDVPIGLIAGFLAK